MALSENNTSSPSNVDKRTDALVAIAADKEEAEVLRRFVSRLGNRLWVFVYPQGKTLHITVSNEWGGHLKQEEVNSMVLKCNAFLDRGDGSPVPDEEEEEPITERAPKLLS